MPHKIKILIVENEPDTVQTVEMLFRDYGGFDVVVALKGAEGIALAQKEHPDMLLLNLDLPDMSGFRVFREAKAANPDLMVYVFTGFDDEEFRDRAVAMGARDYLVKPMPMEQILAKIQEGASELERRKKG